MSAITKQDVIDQLDQLDPTVANDPACLYTNSNGDHCIAGQILANLGRALPPVDSAENQAPISGPMMARYVQGFEREAILFLDELQRTADHDVMPWESGGVVVEERITRFPWGEVVSRVQEGRGF